MAVCLVLLREHTQRRIGSAPPNTLGSMFFRKETAAQPEPSTTTRVRCLAAGRGSWVAGGSCSAGEAAACGAGEGSHGRLVRSAQQAGGQQHGTSAAGQCGHGGL